MSWLAWKNLGVHLLPSVTSGCSLSILKSFTIQTNYMVTQKIEITQNRLAI